MGASKGLNKKWISLLIMALLVLAGLSSGTTVLSRPPSDDPVADVTILPNKVEWQPLVKYASLTLTVAGPGDLVVRQMFQPEQTPTFGLTDEAGQRWPDGVYNYELVAAPLLSAEARAALEEARKTGALTVAPAAQIQSGHFAIKDGAFVTGGAEAAPDPSPLDQVILDDLIVDGSICVGFDCVNGESFGFDTLRLKENNLRIHFQDTSNSASFPSNDWRIVINDSANGGASYFAIDDVDGGRTPFKIVAGAPSNSIYVSSSGNLGLGTSTPGVEAHIADGDSPTVRLEQNNSSGWTAQTWDVAGNETNFFVRDVTNGSKLPFRIRPNAPSNSIYIDSDGDIGMGTTSPGANLEVETTGESAKVIVQRTDGASSYFSAQNNKVVFGSETNHKMSVFVNNALHTTFETNGDVTVDHGTVHATAFNPTSDVNAKENFSPVDGKEVLARLEDIPITTWNFKGDEVRHMGPTAQDFGAAFGLGTDDKHIATVDADGVALAAIKELNAQNKALKAENAALKTRVGDLETRMAVLEAKVTGKAPAAEPVPSSLLPGAGLLLAGLTLPAGVVWKVRRDRNR